MSKQMPDSDVEVTGVPVQEQPRMVTVVAPSNLAAGYTFTAQVDGKDFVVTVPEGGVEEGQQFEVPYPMTTTTAVTTITTTNSAPAMGSGVPLAPQGRWRTGLCGCFEIICCSPLCCQAWLCTGLLIGQLAQRFKLDCCGGPSGVAPSNAHNTWTMIWGIFIVCILVGISEALYLPMAIFMTIVIMNIRYAMRKKYEIQPSCCNCCDGKLDDCCCGWFCTCCVAIQMARHTHDNNQYAYMCCEPTGLPPNAPECV